MLTKSQKKIADALFDVGAIKFGAFKLKAHELNPDLPDSPIYLNLRTDQHPVPEKRGPLTPAIMNMIGDEFALVLDKHSLEYSLFADIPEAGTPFGDQVQRFVAPSVGRLTLVKAYRPDGSRFICHIHHGGQWLARERVLLVDDLLSGADTKLEAVNVLEDAGLYVWKILVLIDRFQGGWERLGDEGIRVEAVMNLPDMLEHYVDVDKISVETYREVMAYLAQPIS